MGLAPLLVTEIFSIIKRLNEEERVGMLLAEQNAVMALNYAEYGYIMENGRVVLDGDAATLRENADVREFYLGLTAIGKKSYRDVKHYHRRKRWLA
jgi:branched-chain amino acid transport system ATP-binding protein